MLNTLTNVQPTETEKLSQLWKDMEAKIESLDLEPLIFKLTDKQKGHGWSLSDADKVARIYRRYLFLIAMNPNLAIPPNEEIDTFWHTHILDTAKYAQDCQDVFGHFIHHFPYFGMRGNTETERAADKTRLDDAFVNNTTRLFADIFSINIQGEEMACDHGACFTNVAGVAGIVLDRPRVIR